MEDMHTAGSKNQRSLSRHEDIQTIWMILAATAATAGVMLWMLRA